ncbi:class I SAM-dependent methyltransferase [Actinotalea solisilvae]|uniref:class I SAM-dependent methyltransferase n=1 Tax=Actinotalea solisilvae TaxID=2072922 RepID=UPI0018F16D16|nr:class I SAM-dependent methyltransferase [Actinotalea solisilvae]
MPTDYDAQTFAERYNRSRALSEGLVQQWATVLAARTPAQEVSDVLDAGCGTGRFWPVFRLAWSPHRIVAVDRSASMLLTARPGSDVVRVVGDLNALPLRPDPAFDVVFVSMSLHYSSDPQACVAELVARLRPGGRLFVRTGTDETLLSFDFLAHFPSALAAERRAMPRLADLMEWLKGQAVTVVAVETVAAATPTSRRRALRQVVRRGFPSLELVSRGEFVLGTARYAVNLALTWVMRRPRPPERSVLVTARRP